MTRLLLSALPRGLGWFFVGILIGLAIVLTFGCATPPPCCWRADANPPLARVDDPGRVHGWCDVVNADEVCVRPVGR